MKKFYLLLLALFCFSCLSTKTGIIDDNQDKFTGERIITVFLNFSDAFHQSELRFHYHVSSQDYFLSFYIWDTDWLFIDKIYFIIDQQRDQFQAIDNKRDIHSDGDITEIIYFNSSADFIKKLSMANDIEMKVSGEKRSKEYIFNDSHKEAIIDFLMKINNL